MSWRCLRPARKDSKIGNPPYHPDHVSGNLGKYGPEHDRKFDSKHACEDASGKIQHKEQTCLASCWSLSDLF